MTTMRLLQVISLGIAAIVVGTTVSAQHQHPAGQDHPYDLQFIDMMLHHHQDGIRMSAIETSKGDRDAVKAFAQKTADGQKKDSEELQAVRDRLFKGHAMAQNARVGGMTMDAMMKKGQQSLQKLEKAGDRPDETFLQTMAGHHQDALRMSAEGMKRLQDGELRKLAARINGMQTKELDEIKHLRSMAK